MKTTALPVWVTLVAMWLLLNGTVTMGQAIVGGLVAFAAVRARALLQSPSSGLRRPFAAVRLVAIVLGDIVRSNVEVAGIVLRPGNHGRVAGFVDIPLDTRNPVALASLACIITATPGTAWAGYDTQSNTLKMHALHLVDRAASVRTIKERYERPLMEIFE